MKLIARERLRLVGPGSPSALGRGRVQIRAGAASDSTDCGRYARADAGAGGGVRAGKASDSMWFCQMRTLSREMPIEDPHSEEGCNEEEASYDSEDY